jgi:2-keto-3-deoxy-L-rhamnonate aldolase RhmA
MIDKIEALEGVIGVIIGHSYGGKSLGKQSRTGAVKVQRIEVGGIKAATQSAKGLQELFIRTKADQEEAIAEKIAAFS